MATPHEWAKVFTSILEAAGFPGERALDSAEFQARAKFNDMLAEMGKLNVVFEKIPSRKAIENLKTLCTALFQPESPEAPIQVLGVLESLGLEFDALWVSGLTENAWPLRASANPFLPLVLQKKAGIPEASAEKSLERAKRITAEWAGAAKEVVFSWPEHEQDRALLPSPLISGIPEGEIVLPVLPSFKEVLFEARKIETLHDEKAPAVVEKAVRGGTRVLADQAACPFRAFARHRLGAEAMESPAEGLDDSDRGRLLHALMAEIWKEMKDSQGLRGDFSSVLSRSARKAIQALKIEGTFAELEQARLVKLAQEWLSIEQRREPFSVVATEEPLEIPISGLTLKGRIDRMDRLPDGSHVLIDYKSGEASTRKWMGERPEEPQLPLYALASRKDIGAVAFAKLKTGEMGFAGVSRAKGVLPKVEPPDSWDELLRKWKTETEKLATQFAGGDARVDPKTKKGLQTCRLCDLQPLCRVHERLASLDDDAEGA